MHTFIRLMNYMVVSSLICLTSVSHGNAEEPKSMVKENVEKLLATKSCPGCDLSAAILNRLDLSEANLQGANLSMAKLYLTDLSQANLSEANLQGAEFGGADLAGADLRGADLAEAKFFGAYLAGAMFDKEAVDSKVYLTQESINSVEAKKDLSEGQEVNIAGRRDIEEPPPAVIMAAKPVVTKREEGSMEIVPQADHAPVLSEKPLINANVTEVDPVKPEVNEMKATTVDVVAESTLSVDKIGNSAPPSVNESTQDLEKPEPQNAVVIQKEDDKEEVLVNKEEVRGEGETQMMEKENHQNRDQVVSSNKDRFVKELLQDKSCYRCDLTGVDLSGKDLDKVDLEGANLTGSNLEGVDLRKANLKATILVGANLRNAKLEGADLYKADMRGADLTGADLEKVKMDDVLISGVKGLQVESIMLQEE